MSKASQVVTESLIAMEIVQDTMYVYLTIPPSLRKQTVHTNGT